MQHSEIAGLMKALAPVVGDFVARAVGPLRQETERLREEIDYCKKQMGSVDALVVSVKSELHERIAATHQEIADAVTDFKKLPLPEKGEPGKDAEPIDMTQIFSFVIQSVNDAVAKVPVPTLDRDAEQALVAALVNEAVALLPPGEPGKSVTVQDVKPIIDGQLSEALSAFSPLLDDVIKVANSRIEEAIAAIPEIKNVTVDDVMPAINTEIMMQAGKFDLAVADAVARVQHAISLIPEVKDGSSVTVEDVAPLINEQVFKACNRISEELVAKIDSAIAAIPEVKDGVGLAGAVIDRHGHFLVTLTDGKNISLGQIVGKDADEDRIIEEVLAKIPVPKDGADGVGFDDLDVAEVDGEVVIRFIKGDVAKGFVLPVPVYHDVWKDKSYNKNAMVTYGGSIWIAKKDTATKPDTPGSDWKLAVKRGRDGGSAYDIARKAGFKGTEREWIDSIHPPKPVKVDQ